MRFKRDDMIIFQITTRDGSTLPNFDTLPPIAPDPDKQTMVVFEVTPYLRDGGLWRGRYGYDTAYRGIINTILLFCTE